MTCTGFDTCTSREVVMLWREKRCDTSIEFWDDNQVKLEFLNLVLPVHVYCTEEEYLY